MNAIIAKLKRFSIAALGASAMLAAPLSAQSVESVDPDTVFTGAIDGDLTGEATDVVEPAPDYVEPAEQTVTEAQDAVANDPFAEAMADYSEAPSESVAGESSDVMAVEEAQTATTYGEDDLIGAAEGVFGKGAEGLAGLIQDLLKDQGEPNAYIVGREAGGAFIVGARYGSGTLHHKIEGERKVYWTGPSIGFDAGANAGNTFVLVYNLFDTEDIYSRFPAGEGQAYLIGGLHASYVRKGDVVMIPIRVGAGLRLGVNAGYMKFSKKQRWLPF